MPRDELKRLLMHLVHGALPAWWIFGWPVPGLIPLEVSWVSMILGLIALAVFIIYQVFNQVGKGKRFKGEPDDSWKDVQGICWGWAIAGSLFGILWRLL
jgi:hypothetical protein